MRFASIVSVFVLSLGVFACGGEGEPDDGSSPASESEVVEGSGGEAKSPALGIEVRQGDRGVSVARSTEGKEAVGKVALKAGAFKLRFPKQKSGVAIQITGWTDASIFNAAVGSSAREHGSFGDARGIAGSGDGTLYLDNEGNNYLVERDEVSFASTFKAGARTPLSEQKRDLFLAVFIDKNQNRQFDAGEVEYLVLTF